MCRPATNATTSHSTATGTPRKIGNWRKRDPSPIDPGVSFWVSPTLVSHRTSLHGSQANANTVSGGQSMTVAAWTSAQSPDSSACAAELLSCIMTGAHPAVWVCGPARLDRHLLTHFSYVLSVRM